MRTKSLSKTGKPSAAYSEMLLQATVRVLLGERPTPAQIARVQAIPIDVRLRREGIYHFDEIIHLQSKEWLINNFGPGREYPVNVSKLIKNIIWQVRSGIVDDKAPPISGLIRSFWYSHIKPALARAGALNSKVDQYAQMIQLFVRLIQYCNFLRYRELGFIDDNQNDRKIGIYDYIILFAEKAGHFPLLQAIAKDTEVTILSLGGQPSLLSAEYFVDELKAKGIDIRKSFYTFSLVDYDTSGWIIRDAFLNDLRFYGLRNISHQDLILPTIFTKEEIELNKYLIPTSPALAPKNKKWLKESGGINGELYGIESDAAPAERIKELFLSKTKELTDFSEKDRRSRAYLSISSALNDYILAKLQI
jgi:hypothetical protein